MRKSLEYLRSHPIIAAAIVVGLVGIIVIVLASSGPPPVADRPLPSAPTPGTTPGPQATPGGAPGTPGAPAVATTPGQPAATPTPRPSPTARTVSANAGRPDPFAPLVRSEGPGAQPAGVPVPPPAPLPPPLFPGQPQPGQPVPAPAATPAPPKDASTAELVGIIGDSGGTAIVKLGGKTYIVGQGDLILNKIRVTVVDVTKGLVILEEDGERFELKLGGVSGGHVAAIAPSGTN